MSEQDNKCIIIELFSEIPRLKSSLQPYEEKLLFPFKMRKPQVSKLSDSSSE